MRRARAGPTENEKQFMKVLEGIKVLDFGRFIAGPYCAALLADYGADVIRIDRVEGGEDRYIVPVTEGGEGAMFLQLNRNKRSMTLDLDSPQGREIVRKLVAGADVVIANMPPRTLKSLGLDYATLSFSTREATSGTFTPAARCGGSDTLSVFRRGATSTPRSSGLIVSSGFFLAFMMLGKVT
ncbi:CoA-transferase family III domain protein [Bordetella bronchiseptica D993]|nr:CoA-transferase family III domain protein [Bordetella bronchiseptica D993]